MEQQKVFAALAKTGFPLENYVSRRFTEQNWQILSNRYYVDDVDGKARELDLIAYRAVTVGEIELVVGALVSCKKDDENAWVFLTREKPKKDPNHDWNPINQWTNHEPLSIHLATDGWKNRFYEKSGAAVRKLFSAERDVFARQLVSKSKHTPKDDRPMFDATSGLMKAMVHELKLVSGRPKKQRFYIMIPVVVVEADFIEAAFEENAEAATEVNMVSQLTNYIVGRKDVSAIVHFVRREELPSFIKLCDSAFRETQKYIPTLVKECFESISSSKEMRAYFLALMKDQLNWTIRWRGKRLGMKGDISVEGLTYSNNKLVLEIDCLHDQLHILQESEKFNSDIAAWLKEKARYEGEYELEASIPF